MADHLFYIHGFNSSPRSAKARVLGEYVARHHPALRFHVPALPYDPSLATQRLAEAIQACLPERVGLVGSSLGGFYGAWAAERFGMRLVLVNPAVHAHRLLAHHLGEQTNLYTGERYVFTQAHVDILRSLAVDSPTHPDRYMLLAQTGDETLDYREAEAVFASSPRIIERGGSHGFDGFERYLPGIIEFLFGPSD